VDPALRNAIIRAQSCCGVAARFQAIFRALRFHLPGDRPLDGLEVGVGTGDLILALSDFVPNVKWQGVDIPRRHATYQQAFDALMARRSIRVVDADLTRNTLPFGAGTFDAVSFSEVIEHLPANGIMPALCEIGRVLRPGGILVATSPNLLSLMNRILLLLGHSPFHLPIAEDHSGSLTYPHIHLYSASEFKLLCRAAGLDPVGCEHLTYLTHAFFGGSAARNAVLRAYLAAEAVLGAVAPALKDGWLVAARKP
jgi:SAM-dependent methyltransferase